MTERKEPETNLLSEGWFTDLAAAVAAGGTQGIKDMIANKLQKFAQMAGDMENSQALDMVQRFRKMGLRTLGGEDLEKVERALLKQKAKADKAQGRGAPKVDPNKLLRYITGVQESTRSYKGASLKDTFLID
jgi:hypothetical protein